MGTVNGPRDGPPPEALRADLILDALSDAVLVADSDGRILDINARACEFYGLTRAELVGRLVVELRAKDERPLQADLMARVAAAGQLRFETVPCGRPGSACARGGEQPRGGARRPPRLRRRRP